MTARMRYPRTNPTAFRAMKAMQDYVDGSGLEHDLLELVKLLASYLNGCAFCVDMHTKDAHFDEEELVDLTLAVIAINGWNRLNIAFRTEVGRYRPARVAGSAA